MADSGMNNAADARRILDDPTFKKAMADVRAEVTQDWKRTRPDDTAGREKLWLTLNAVDRLEERLEAYVLDGKMAERRETRA